MNDLTQYRGWALITGASAGIGREFARAIAAHKVPCVLVARRLDRLNELADELRAAHGVKCRCVAQDLAAPDSVDCLLAAVSDLPIGILVNNAGFGHAGRFHTRDPQRLGSMVNVNCAVPALLTRALVPQMLERKRGAIIIVSSVLGFVACPYESVYAATKAFDLQLGASLYAELRPLGIDVVTLCPQATRTEILTAQGFSEESVKARQRLADEPEKVVAIALRSLGRKPVTGPFFVTLAGLMHRVLPRKLEALLMRPMMAKVHLAEEVE
ncbi:MAG: SDR family oxidoreductase [Candidatus Hydrogenedentes bacterium]|nr:SDR family oxidoreductase [Candidatus Hydrogenedentota bacterium]